MTIIIKDLTTRLKFLEQKIRRIETKESTTSSGASSLTLEGTDSSIIFAESSTNYWSIGQDSSDSNFLKINKDSSGPSDGTTVVEFDYTNETVTIGNQPVTGAARKLTVSRTGGACEVGILSSATGTAALYFGDSFDSSIGGIEYNNSFNEMYFRVANTTRIKIGGTGFVSIGTTSASQSILTVNGAIAIADGIATPATSPGWAQIWVNSFDGDLKVRFGDGTIRTIVTD